MLQRKIRMTREMAVELFPVAGYGLTRFSRNEKADQKRGGWWIITPSPLVKGAPFLKQRSELEV